MNYLVIMFVGFGIGLVLTAFVAVLVVTVDRLTSGTWFWQ